MSATLLLVDAQSQTRRTYRDDANLSLDLEYDVCVFVFAHSNDCTDVRVNLQTIQ